MYSLHKTSSVDLPVVGGAVIERAGEHDAARSGSHCLPSLLEHMREEYEEMPGLCLTVAQARRLWAIDTATCQMALAHLVREGVLRLSSFGYVRA